MKSRFVGVAFACLIAGDLLCASAETLEGRDGDIAYAIDGISLQRVRNVARNFGMSGPEGRSTEIVVRFTSHGSRPVVGIRSFELVSATDDTGNSLLPDGEFVKIGFREIDDSRFFPVQDTPGIWALGDNDGEFRISLKLPYPAMDATTISLAGQFEYTTDSEAGVLEVSSLRDKVGEQLLPADAKVNLIPIVVGEFEKDGAVQQVVHVEITGPYERGVLGDAQFFDGAGNEIRPQTRIAGLYMPDIEAQGPSAVRAYLQWASAQPQDHWNKPFEEVFAGTPWEDTVRPAIPYQFPSALPQRISMVMPVPTEADATTVEFRFEDVKLP